ncbi:hypothetical protein OG361_23325 [Streptomyces sp. NBC_00090]|uniref:hypothetical protein n=1 Tax=Streptomyces sp. NBC_00090 TaxID=2903619 RepID=UPI00324917C6
MNRTTRTTRTTASRGRRRALGAALAVLASSAVLTAVTTAPAVAEETPSPSPSQQPVASVDQEDVVRQQRVAFVEQKDVDGVRTSTIVTINADGTDRREIAPVSWNGARPQGEITAVTFSPDGLRMAFIVHDGAPDVWTAGADGTGASLAQTNVEQVGTRLDELDWTADGRSLYLSFRPEAGQTRTRLMRMTVGSSQRSYVFDTPENTWEQEADVAWDGRLAFVRGGVIHLWDPRTGGEPRPLTRGSHPEFRPDGLSLSFSNGEDGSFDIHTYSFGDGSTHAVTQGQDIRTFEHSPYRVLTARLSGGEKPQAVVGEFGKPDKVLSGPDATASSITWAVPPGSTPWGQRPHDYGGTVRPDVFAQDSTGVIWRYESNGRGGLEPRVKSEWGWKGWRLTAVGDLSGDGWADALAQDPSGDLWRVDGSSYGFQSKVKIGWGWKNLRLTGTGDMNADGSPDVIAVDPAGALWVYQGDGHGGLKSRFQHGGGYQNYRLTAVGSMEDHGSPAVLAQKSNGDLYLYTRHMNSRTLIGWGWQNLTLTGVGDLTGDGIPDVLARDTAGVLWRYDGDGAGGLKPRTKIGWGWNGLSLF